MTTCRANAPCALYPGIHGFITLLDRWTKYVEPDVSFVLLCTGLEPALRGRPHVLSAVSCLGRAVLEDYDAGGRA